MITLSYYQTRALLAAHQAAKQEVITSLDLNQSTVRISFTDDGVLLPDDSLLPWKIIREISDNESVCYTITDHNYQKIQFFSEAFNRVYTLMPTQNAPTMLVSGIPMHRIKNIEPYQDTKRKIRTISPLFGRVLDTATGLGYTAIESAKSAEHVITIELDPTVLEICRLNPWSQSLFDNPHIEQRLGDAFDVVLDFPDDFFNRVVHDPPMFNMAGHLYSTKFYQELHRILKPRGRLFHYIGNPKSSSGRGVTKGVIGRLRLAGFQRIQRRPQAFGVIVSK